MKCVLLYAITCLLMLTRPLIGQNTVLRQQLSFGQTFESDDWIILDLESRIAPELFFAAYGQELGLGAEDDMKSIKSSLDRLGWVHDQYQQMHRGIPVEFAVFNLHSMNGQTVKANGIIEPDVRVDTKTTISRDEARQLAIACIGAGSYNWESAELESLKKHATGDPDATFYPPGELLISDADFNPETPARWHLAWKFEIHAHSPTGRYWVYVDAHSGEILKELNLDIHEAFPGTAVTRYSGIRDIIADSTESGFVLRDATRGSGVETYDAVDSSDMQYAVDFTDDDNYWDLANDRADDAATDAHWATSMFYDYFLHEHGIDSYNGKGSKLISYVHVRQNWRNARWTGFWSEYGDAGGDPWTYIDVVGHEFAHGFTRANSSLIYSRESGALNESFSDIIGEAIEHYANDGAIDWHATPAPVDTIRSYSAPNNFEDPDTYLGDFWWTEAGDNYGVHSNSGVQNHWFYLLSQGGEGTNDHGDTYFVDAIGFDKAMDIVIRNATKYLTPTSGYADARQGSLFAAEDLFGSCSFEYRQVANAWFAVGVGEPVETEDFSVIDVRRYDLCNIADEEFVTITIKHLGCDSTGPVTIDLSLQKTNSLLLHDESLELSDGVAPGEIIEYTFTEPFDFSRTGVHEITVGISSAGDLNESNNRSETIKTHQLAPLTDHAFRFYTGIAPRTFRDSLAFITGEFTNVAVLFNAGRKRTPGIRIEGGEARNALPVFPGEDVFDLNERFGTKICMCIDATGLDTLGLHFEYRMTYSGIFAEDLGIPQPPTSTLRVLANDQELGRFTPLSHRGDKWQWRDLDLSAFLGQQVTLCFETRTLQSRTSDHDNIGDRVFLDNIVLTGQEISSSTSPEDRAGSLALFPNPATSEVFINLDVEDPGMVRLTILSSDGREALSKGLRVASGTNLISLDTGTLPTGLYLVQLKTDQNISTGKLFVER